MKVSFVIPTRNQAPFIRRCIDSCLAQQIDGAEVLVRDGLSTDGTQEILASYGAQISWKSEKDTGQSDAVNQGIAGASGEIIAWINSDDYYAGPEVMRRVLARFARDPDIDLVYGDGLMVDAAGRPIRPYRARAIASARELVLHPASPLSQPAVFFKKSLFTEVGGLDDTLHFGLDYELWIRMWRRAKKSEYLPETLAHATYHEDAKSVAGMWKQIHEVGLIKRRHRDLLRGPVDRARLLAGTASLYAYWLATRLGLKRAV